MASKRVMLRQRKMRASNTLRLVVEDIVKKSTNSVWGH
jgi:hypothetical protein